MTKTMAIQFYQSDMYSVSFANQTLLHYTLLIHFNIMHLDYLQV